MVKKVVSKPLLIALSVLMLMSFVGVRWFARSERVFEKVFEVHKKSMGYLHEAHPKIMILFSGTPGMGKTVVAKRLEERFHAVRLSTDDVRIILRKQGLKEDLANTYLEWCARKLLKTGSNHFLVFDKSIDRTFNMYTKIAKEHLCDVF